MTESVPCPSASGANVKTIHPLTRPPIVGTSSSSQGWSGLAGFVSQRNLCFATRVRLGIVAGHDAHCVMLGDACGQIEADRPNSSHDAHKRRQGEQPDLCPIPVLAELHDLRQPAEEAGDRT